MDFSKLFAGKRILALAVCIFFLTRTFLNNSLIGVNAADSTTVEVQQIEQAGEAVSGDAPAKVNTAAGTAPAETNVSAADMAAADTAGVNVNTAAADAAVTDSGTAALDNPEAETGTTVPGSTETGMVESVIIEEKSDTAVPNTAETDTVENNDGTAKPDSAAADSTADNSETPGADESNSGAPAEETAADKAEMTDLSSQPLLKDAADKLITKTNEVIMEIAAVTRTLTGTVTDDVNGTGIEDAVVILALSGEEKYRVVTGADGTYEITGIEPEVYQLTVEHEYYDTASEEIDLSADGTEEQKLDITLNQIKPTIKATVDPSGWTSASSVNIKVEVSITKGQVANLYYTDGESEQEISINAASNERTIPVDMTGKEGNFSFDFYCTNDRGGQSDRVTVEVKTDQTAPEIEIEDSLYSNGTVTGVITDVLSGVAEVRYKEINAGEYAAAEYDSNTGQFSFAIDQSVTDGVYQYHIIGKDIAGNETASLTLPENPVIVEVKLDRTAPELTLTPAQSSAWINDEIAYRLEIKDSSEVGRPTIKSEGGLEAGLTPGDDSEGESGGEEGIVYYTITIPKQTFSGTYTVSCEDAAGNKKDLPINVNMDDTAGEDISFSANPAEWTKEKVILSGMVRDVFSGIKDIYLKKGSEGTWLRLEEQGGTVEKTSDEQWTFEYTVTDENCNEDYFIYYIDQANNESDGGDKVRVSIDNTSPELNYNTEYQEDEWTKSSIKISGKVEDSLSGIINAASDPELKYLTCSPGADEGKDGGNGEAATVELEEDGTFIITIPAQCFIGEYTITATDLVGNTETKVLKVMMDNEIGLPQGAVAPETWTNAAVTVTGSASDDYSGIDKVFLVKGENGTPEEITDKSQPDLNSPDMWRFNDEIPAQSYEGNYYLYYTDFAGNISEMKEVPLAVKMDNELPTIIGTLNEDDWSNKEAKWTNTDVTITIAMADNLSGISQLFYKEGEGNGYIPVIGNDSREDGVLIEPGNQKDSYIVTLPKDIFEGQHTFYFHCIDQAGNKTADINFTANIDITAPAMPTIAYDRPAFSVWAGELLLQTVTLGFYNPSVVITVSATDELSGVDLIECSFEGQEALYVVNSVEEKYNTEADNGSIKFTLPEGVTFNEFMGTVKAVAYDKANNASDKQDKSQDSKGTALDGIIMDSISPTRTITFPAPVRIVSEGNLATYGGDIGSYVNQEKTGSIFFYDNTVTATVKVKEGNFFADDVNVKVNDSSRSLDWHHEGDEHTANITLSGDGEYIITISYTDRSTNKMIDYRSEKITIDTIFPAINVTYSQGGGSLSGGTASIVDGRIYYNEIQSATITVTERNFRAGDIEASFTAKNVAGEDIEGDLLAALKAQLSSGASWSSNGDTHTAAIVYSADANYTFDISYTDLAFHRTDNYEGDDFAVDTTAPTNLNISYQAGIFEAVLEAITFGYYNSKVAVTVTAEDVTSGVSRFEYSYLRGAGVSNVNAELLEQTVTGTEIRYSNNGLNAAATFEIPRDALTGNNQFNGTIDFAAYDRSDNSTEEIGRDRLVVDNMAPMADITFNQPVQEANGISYYNGNIEANIHITEANFFSEDVTVTVTHNGAAAPADVRWSNNSEDEHIGTFTLSEAGDYTVNVAYNDRSENGMVEYTSDRLTIDIEPPTLEFVGTVIDAANPTVKGIENESAHNADTVGFTITAADINMDAGSFRPVLTAVVMQEDGKLARITLSNGTMETVQEGEIYVYRYDNLEADGIYSLTCMVTDMAGQTTANFSVMQPGNEESVDLSADNRNSDSSEAQSEGAAVETVTFSVNRNGSTFMPDESTQKLVDNYYVRNIQKDVVLIETNVDSIESHEVTLNGTKLTEGYQVIEDGQEGNWHKYTYIIDKAQFAAEGEYRVVVSSQDKAENNAFSDMKGAEINYIVDETPPTITPSGIQAGGIYEIDSQAVTIIPRDDGGRLNSLKVIINDDRGNAITDANGENISVRIDLAGEELFTALEEGGGKLNFTIPAGTRSQNVRIVSNDCARDENGNTNVTDLMFGNITVSTNPFILFYANKPLFFGTVGGILLAAGAGTSVIIIRRRRLPKIIKS